MTSTYERTFVVKVPVERAWKAFVDPRDREAWISPPGLDPVENAGKGYQDNQRLSIPVKVGEVDPLHSLNWSVGHALPTGDLLWADINVTFEQLENGTRITITRSGFGESEDAGIVGQNTALGLDESIIDLIAFLERGVNVSRHYSYRSSIAAHLIETSAGLQVTHVIPGGFAEDAGLARGDLLISIGGAGTYSRSDIAFFEREHDAGENIEVTYVRDGSLLRSSGCLSERFYTAMHEGAVAP